MFATSSGDEPDLQRRGARSVLDCLAAVRREMVGEHCRAR
jgi:hypothetical protein